MSGLKVGVALSQVHLLLVNTIARPYWELYLQGNQQKCAGW